ncbi:lipase family protein [Aliikangiella coralliicola]|uniref:Lipase family protein n=1 Tax=Aliikangiella coralliicola TaxID=2592383 RepID=A0A545UIP5_9GAMM|nr:lipase family protein [Aliikangiella coralliicola]TQV89341.1 lipase family protein [Aliikangiella coralliicola]
MTDKDKPTEEATENPVEQTSTEPAVEEKEISEKYFKSKSLMKPPVNRAAFSDRQAWLMAEFSRLAYFPFEGGHQIEKFLDIAESIVDNDALFKKIKQAADLLLGSQRIGKDAAESSFKKILTSHGFELVGVFNENDTQGFVAKKGSEAYLIYRGTESFGDVKADISAKLIEVEYKDSGIKAEVHSGFWQQFMDADPVVTELLKEVEDCRLHISGHSLGGALANLATKFYAGDSSGSTYTFGAPAVSPPKFQDGIKTPIYRIVNARDPVPLLPNPAMVHALGFLWHYFTRLTSIIGGEKQKEVAKLLKDMARMNQIGYPSRIIYVGNEPKLRYSFSIYQRVMLWMDEPWFNFSLEKRFVSDHKISRYTNALKKWGETRVGNEE